jgi:hypothetical protein
MAGRSRPTFKKRQRELARRIKQQEKAERRAQRKLEKQSHTATGEATTGYAETPPGSG